MNKYVCTHYTPQSNICNCKSKGLCKQAKIETDVELRLDLEFRCPRQNHYIKHVRVKE